ncbi:MAG: LamG domain-containing protein [Verrucomicrobiae bacterium]|nr:LamG domain-containing protein [Verrucomicrobiae bacterium]
MKIVSSTRRICIETGKTARGLLAALMLLAAFPAAWAGLVSEWKFAGDFKDSAGRSNGGLKNEEAQWAPDRFDNPDHAILLSGKGGYIDCGNAEGLSFGNGKKDRPFTIEAWVKMKDRAGFVIAGKKGEYALTNNNNLRLYFWNGNTGARVSRSAVDLAGYENNWVHIIVAYNGSGDPDGVVFYLNGGKTDGKKEGDWEKYEAMKEGGASFCIGGPADQDEDFEKVTANGSVGEVRVYNHALTANEARDRYEQTFPCRIKSMRPLVDLIESDERELRRLSKVHPHGKAYAQSVGADLADLKAKAEKCGDGEQSLSYSGFAAMKEERDMIEKRLGNHIDELKKTLKAVENGVVAKEAPFICHRIDPMSRDVRQILPFWGGAIPGEISNEIKIAACAGEYEPASFVIVALADLNSLQVRTSDLKLMGAKSQTEIIPASALDVKLVKCWYQSGSAGWGFKQNKLTRKLIPELLVNDDSLVKVDFKKGENYLRLGFPKGNEYIWISDPAWDAAKEKEWKPEAVSIDKFPVKDSPVLLPVNIPAGRNQQFWLTVRAPADAKPGLYEGKISLMTPGREVGSLSLKLQVLPFELSAPYYTFSIDYHAKLSEIGTVSSVYKNRSQFKRELENMVAHGLSNCQHYGIKKGMLGEVLKIRKEAGMDNGTLYLKGTIPIGNPTEPKALEQVGKNVRAILEFVRPFGVQTVYFYGIDEARGSRLKSQRQAWETARAAGGRIFVAGGEDNIKFMGDIQDMHVRAGPPSAKEVAQWHSRGHKIFCYNNPQCGVEDPEIYRRNFGLLLWKNDYDGAADNAYQHSFGFTWNDFGHPFYRSPNQTYATAEGPIDTIQWEGYREAVDDVRYVTTLQKTIETARKSGDEKLLQRADVAEDYLKKLKSGDAIDKGNLGVIRSEIISQILGLQGK